MSGKFKRLLVEIGLNYNESLLFIGLLKSYPISIQDLSKKLEISDKEVSQSIENLCELKLVFYDSEKVWVINPRKSFSALLNDRIWSITNSIYSDFNDIPDDLKPYCRNIITIYNYLIKHAMAFYKQRSPISFEGIKKPNDTNQFISLIAEKISQADNEILSVSSSPHIKGLALIWGAIYDRIINGIVYRRIIDFNDFHRTGLLINSRDIEEIGVDLYVTDSNLINQKFYIIDKDHLVLFSPNNDTNEKFLRTGQLIKNRFVVSKFRTTFGELLSKSIKAINILKVLQSRKLELVSKAKKIADKDELAWFLSIIDYGVFSKSLYFIDKNFPSSIEKFKEKNLIIVDEFEGRNQYLPNFSFNFNEYYKKYFYPEEG